MFPLPYAARPRSRPVVAAGATVKRGATLHPNAGGGRVLDRHRSYGALHFTLVCLNAADCAEERQMLAADRRQPDIGGAAIHKYCLLSAAQQQARIALPTACRFGGRHLERTRAIKCSAGRL